MAELWRTQDRLGREVVFKLTRLNHVQARYADMISLLDEVRPTIERPDYVMRDTDYPHRENHYRLIPSIQRFVKVVVAYRPTPPSGTWEGEVITAHIAKKRKRKETVLWP